MSLVQSLEMLLVQSLVKSLVQSLMKSLFNSPGEPLFKSVVKALVPPLAKSLVQSLVNSLFRSLVEPLVMSQHAVHSMLLMCMLWFAVVTFHQCYGCCVVYICTWWVLGAVFCVPLQTPRLASALRAFSRPGGAQAAPLDPEQLLLQRKSALDALHKKRRSVTKGSEGVALDSICCAEMRFSNL